MLFCVLGYCVMEFKWNLRKKLMIDTRGTGPEVEITPRNLSDFSEFVGFFRHVPDVKNPIAGLPKHQCFHNYTSRRTKFRDEERLFLGCLAN